MTDIATQEVIESAVDRLDTLVQELDCLNIHLLKMLIS